MQAVQVQFQNIKDKCSRKEKYIIFFFFKKISVPLSRMFVLYIVVLCVALPNGVLSARGQAGSNPVTRTGSIPLTNSDSRQLSIEQSLQSILHAIEENQEEVKSALQDIMEISRRTQQEMLDLQQDMELLLGTMYKPSCQEIAQEQHDIATGRTNEASIGVFVIKPPKFKPAEVRCELERGAVGWTVIVSRTDGKEQFNRTYKEYQDGFGKASGDYWIGNDMLHKLTTWRPHQLRVVMEDWEGHKAWVQYNVFKVAGPEDNYRLTIGQFEADSSVADGFSIHNDMLFSTYDKDDDSNKDGNCAQLFGAGGGWWYNNCYHVLPTGRYRSSGGNAYGGIAWHPFKNVKYSLKSLSLMIKRTM